METLLGLIVGVGLSAACGFRVFVPLLGMSVASMSGHLELSPGFAWIGTVPALIAFASATVLEVGAYYLPWFDNLMDVAATPAAVAAGTVVTASMVGEVSPFLQWSLAAIAGGGVAGTVQFGTVALRSASSVTTGGFGNFMVSTMELLGAIVTTLLAILLPILGLAVVAWVMLGVMKRTRGSVASSPAGVGSLPESTGCSRTPPPPPPA